MKTLVFSISFVLIAFFVSSNATSAEQYIYKWKDAQGMVHYTERPPEKGIAFEKVRRERDTGKKRAQQTVSQQAEKAEDAKDDSYGSWRKENCKIATQNLDVLENAARIAADDGQGGTRLMTDEEKAEKIKKMTEQKQKYCPEEEN